MRAPHLQAKWLAQRAPLVCDHPHRLTTLHHACRSLYTDKPKSVPLVEAELITLQLTAAHAFTARSPGEHVALLMPKYAGSVVMLMQLPPAVILAQGKRMQAALEYVHSRGYVHMDVKVCTGEGRIRLQAMWPRCAAPESLLLVLNICWGALCPRRAPTCLLTRMGCGGSGTLGRRCAWGSPSSQPLPGSRRPSGSSASRPSSILTGKLLRGTVGRTNGDKTRAFCSTGHWQCKRRGQDGGARAFCIHACSWRREAGSVTCAPCLAHA